MSTELNNQYAPPKSTVADVASADEGNKADRITRLGASILDGLIGFAGFIPSYIQFIGTAAKHSPTSTLGVWGGLAKTGPTFFVGLLWLLVVLAANLYFLHKNGQSIGKKLLHIKVVRKDGSRATLPRLFFLRYVLNTFFTMIPVVGSLYSLVDCLMIFGREKRCVHDYLADTIVIKA